MFSSVLSDQGNTCSQFFTGLTSHRWAVYPLKTESDNFKGLQDYTREVGCPNVLISDNSRSETDTEWTEHL